MSDFVDVLRQSIEKLIEEKQRLTEERDEARREVCYREHELRENSVCKCSPLDYADRLNWDCFKEEMARDTLSQEVSQETDKLPTTISSNGIRITKYIPPQMSVHEIPPHDAYSTGKCTLHNISVGKTSESQVPDNNPDKVSQLEDTDSAAFQSYCTVCGVPWASHMGIAGTCAANAQLRNERDEARREVCNWSVGVGLKATSQAVAEGRGWDCYKETP